METQETIFPYNVKTFIGHEHPYMYVFLFMRSKCNLFEHSYMYFHLKNSTFISMYIGI